MLPNANYMDKQNELNWDDRWALVNWLIHVHQQLGLLPEVLFLAVNYLDRFLSRRVISKTKLQLAGISALRLADKYENDGHRYLAVDDILRLSFGAYPRGQIIRAECVVLEELQWDLGWPGPLSFLRRISEADDFEPEIRTLARYFLEVALMDSHFVAIAPSLMAAGAYCLALFMLQRGSWSFEHYLLTQSKYTHSDLEPLLEDIIESCRGINNETAVFVKYSHKRFNMASLVVQRELL